MTISHGVIYFVGAGPGETSLITAKGLALIREADAIVGDLLTHNKLFQEARPEAEQYDVGCRAAHNKIPQAEINQMLIDLAKEGKHVVRVWPGDPFVFGRAAQEMVAAQKAGLRCEFVPGVTSALAVPAYAGVPVTHWEYNTSFAVVSGYESKNPAVQTDWEALSRIETLVIMMPLDRLSYIVEQLITAGRAGETPAVAIQHGTYTHQRHVLATLDTLVETVSTHPIEHPAIVVVGQVAELSAKIGWFQTEGIHPLRGKRILVTRPAHQANDFMVLLRNLGADPISFPTIEIRPVEDSDPLDAAIQRIGSETGPDWLILTSVNGVAAFWNRLEALGLDSRHLASLKIAAIGPATGAALEQRSIKPDLIPELYMAEGILEAIGATEHVKNQRFLLPRADIARKNLAEGLAEQGAIVEEIAAYRTVPLESGSLPPSADIVTFTSSSTVQGYVNCLGDRAPTEALKDSQVFCIGPITARTAQRLGVPVHGVAENYTIAGLVEAITNSIGGER